jgi:FKBP-type peptidyl-prolyl cis-trans isomerase
MPTRLLALVPLLAFASCAWFRPHPPEYETLRFESGLVLRDTVVPDAGVEVAPGDTVAVHYDLRLADRSLVESSTATGRPLRFKVGAGEVPSGLEQGVLGMRLFGRRRLTVPPALAYGSEGRPPRIPPDATLIFDVELMEHVPRDVP